MAPTFTYGELASDLGTSTADGLRNVANAAANFACDAWENYTEYASGFSDPTGIGKFNNALYSRLCTPRNKQPASPLQAQFTGGQCPKEYNVTYTLRYGPNQTTSTYTVNRAAGPILGFTVGSTANANRKKYGIAFQPSINFPDGKSFGLEGNDADVKPVELVSLNAVPRDGSPDNCGDPPPSYPPKTPPSPVTNNTTNVNIGAGVVIAAPITLIPVKVDADVEINPQIQVGVGPFNVTFDAGGVTVAPSFEFGTGGKTTPNPDWNPPGTPTSVTQKVECKPTDLTPVINRLNDIEATLDGIDVELDDIKECTCPVGYTKNTVALGSGDSGVVALPTNCIQVRLNLTSIPANPKIQSGGSNAPVQYFCGYYSFGDGVGLGARTAINVQQSTFEVPLWATSFSWSLYEGYDATVSCVTLVPEKEGAQLATRQMKTAPS